MTTGPTWAGEVGPELHWAGMAVYPSHYGTHYYIFGHIYEKQNMLSNGTYF